MLTDLITKPSRIVRPRARPSRARRVALAVLFGAAVVFGLVYHLSLWKLGEPASPSLRVLFEGIAVAGYAALWSLLSGRVGHRHAAPAKTFWTALLVGLIFLAIGRLIAGVGMPSSLAYDAVAIGFEYETGVPLTVLTVVKMTVLSLGKAIFAFFLLLRLRDLVFFKRTRVTERNWSLMLGFMGLAAVMAFLKDPSSDIGLLQAIPMIPAIGFMAVNSFRLSWIVYLSFREKLAGIGLTLLLLGICMAALTSEGLVPGGETYVAHYSYPLLLFTDLSLGFGVLYCTTSFLSLLFHLPTTSDFQRKAGEVTAMHSLTNLVNQVFDSEKLFRTIVASPVEAGAAQAAWLALPDPQSGTLRPRIGAVHGTPLDRVEDVVDTPALYEEVLVRRESLLLDEAAADHRIALRPGEGLGSLLVVPLIARDELLGALFVAKEVAHGFEQDDVEAISVFAAQASLALDNARLFEEQVEKERLARELSIAREVQRKLLPQCLPIRRGVSICASSVPAQEVGGDYYDFVELDDQRIAFIIADVSGKGTSAAFYMAELQGIFRSVSHLAPSPTEFLGHANRALGQSLEKHVFISVVYGVLDLAREELVLARGGHCPVATINLHGKARFIRSRGMGLGLNRGAFFKQSLVEERIALQPGDVFVLYTDGVVESRDAAGEEYGYTRLLEALRAHRHEDADDLHAALLTDLDTFLGHRNYDDDMTLVVLKWHGIDFKLDGVATGIAQEPGRRPGRAERPVEAE